jgi:16S rRNA (cytosine1402-N4)-methyltransferase
VYVDCTTNRAGHSAEIAKRLGKDGVLVCFDLDNSALASAKVVLESLPESPALHFVHSNFRDIAVQLHQLGIQTVDGVLADLGISSEELDESGRGFTFRFDEPLLMTFLDTPNEETLTARDIVNTWGEESIADILFGYADERYSRRIARAIVEARKSADISTTFALVEIIKNALPAAEQHKKTHFATKTFQALRIATNDEIGSVTQLITSLPNVLTPGGRAAIITFHSTEDRIVKRALKSEHESLHMVQTKAIIPSDDELRKNPRARSAQLRIVEKI